MLSFTERVFDRPLYTRGVFEKLISMMMSATSNSQQNIYRECLEKLVTSKDIILEPTDYQDTLIKVCKFTIHDISALLSNQLNVYFSSGL